MPKIIMPCLFELDYFAELVESLAEPLDYELDDPATRTNKRTRLWGQVMCSDGYRPNYIAGHRSAHNAGRKARDRK